MAFDHQGDTFAGVQHGISHPWAMLGEGVVLMLVPSDNAGRG